MQNINEVIGIVKGISYDGIINNREINFLHSWVDRNRHFAVSMYQKKLIKQIDVALEDKVLTELERNEILSTAQNILKFQKDEYASYIELNGIIEGIISDNEINKEEVLKLNEWFTLHNESMSDDEDVIRKEINKVLEDGVVTSEEQKKLLKLLKEKIVLLEIDSKLKCLKNQIRERNNIGIELIGLLEKDNIMSYIHSRSESILRNALNSYTGTLITNSEIVVVSLSLIAMLNYDGSFYDSVREVYSSLYDQFSEQKVEGLIRSILNRYRSKNDLSSRSRIINYPLRQSIVPRYFLPNFFEFVFDIYKLNFDCNLPEDLYDDFKFVFEGLKSNMRMLGDDLEVNVTKKRYKLIQTTKDLVIKENDLDPLIKLSVMVIQLIDKYMWNKEIRIQNPYLQYGYEKWVSTFKEKEKEGRKRTRSTNRPRWKPKICLQSDTVLLLPPIHKIEYQYNYYDIKIIVKNGEEQLFENKTPDIREIIGGYQIISEKIKIDKPLGKLRYFLMSKDEVIYDSDDQLYRDFIVFDQNGQELINNTDYRGTAIFCTKYCSPAASKDIFFKNDEYKLSSYQVQQGDAVFIDNKVFNFTSLIKPGIFGDKLKNFTIACLDTKKEYPVYKNIKYLIFEDEKIDCTYEISINNRSCALNDYYYTITSKSGLNRYVVYLNINKPNIYSIAINRFYGEKKINIGVFDFVYDPELSVDLNKLTDTTYEVSIKTGLLPDCIREGINLDFFDIDDIQIEYLKKRYAFRIPLGFSAYRISNNTWKPLSEDLWINDIKHDTFLNVYGLDFDSIAIYSSKGTFLEEISVKEKGIYKQAAIGFLISYKSYDFTSMFFLKNGKAINLIRCYNKCVVEDEDVECLYNPVNKELSITTRFKGKGLIFYEIYNQENVKVYKSAAKENRETEIISNLNSFEKYTINIVEKQKGLSLGGGILLKTLCRTFYARKDFVGRSFKIDEVYYYESVGTDLVERICKLRANYVKFTKQIDESTFMGELYSKVNSIYWLYNVNPVMIEVNSDVISGTMDLYITNEGDGLLIDLKHRNIMNNLDDFNAPCIEIYTVDANGKEEL